MSIINLKNFFVSLVVIVVCCVSAACAPKFVYDDEWNGIDWEDITSSAFDDITPMEDIVYDYCIFDANVLSINNIEAVVVDQKDISNYFDEDKIYENFNLRLNVNDLLNKFAVGTGVIVLSVMMSVMLRSGPQAVLCVITGASNAAITGAGSGALIGGIVGGVTSYLNTDGDFSNTLTGMIEGSVDGYMWGAVFGALTGVSMSKYCFVADTLVSTPKGMVPIQDIQIGDMVYSYNHKLQKTEINKVTNTFVNETASLVRVNTQNSVIYATPSHDFYVNGAYNQIKNSKIGDKLFSQDSKQIIINNISTEQQKSVVYNFTVENNHNYFVGNDKILVHNTCINEQYAGKSYHFEGQFSKAQKTNSADDWAVYNSLNKKYPNGVPYVKDEFGNVFPDFTEYVLLQYDFPVVNAENLQNGSCLVGDSSSTGPDFKKFKQKMLDDGFTERQIAEILSTHTIHHNQNMRTLQLVPRDLHSASRHTGGASLIRSIISTMGGK